MLANLELFSRFTTAPAAALLLTPVSPRLLSLPTAAAATQCRTCAGGFAFHFHLAKLDRRSK